MEKQFLELFKAYYKCDINNNFGKYQTLYDDALNKLLDIKYDSETDGSYSDIIPLNISIIQLKSEYIIYKITIQQIIDQTYFDTPNKNLFGNENEIYFSTESQIEVVYSKEYYFDNATNLKKFRDNIIEFYNRMIRKEDNGFNQSETYLGFEFDRNFWKEYHSLNIISEPIFKNLF